MTARINERETALVNLCISLSLISLNYCLSSISCLTMRKL